ncbi:hypothetical protein SDC9_145827 [bioreactor metagenome]|uniref:Uncharacterized protein n=1 Tax=bioreactor metagenome TaxID=1076179 RepID=A0A645EBF5_9ZZZZ
MSKVLVKLAEMFNQATIKVLVKFFQKLVVFEAAPEGFKSAQNAGWGA